MELLKKRIVVKVGTSTITYENGKMNHGNIDKLCRGIADIWNSGREVILVTSGAIGVGIGLYITFIGLLPLC